jgi:predicted short-subunit dehydrogenase-like oxidoreductase (DUF2520 family)
MNIVIIGSGNVATHLALAIKNAGHNIWQIFSRTITNADLLAGMVGAEATNDWSTLRVDADIYLISVTDGHIVDVISKMPQVNGVVAHTAGSLSMDVLSRFSLYGVFYPFQTFTKDKVLNFREVPLLVEGNLSVARRQLRDLAEDLSDCVQKSNEEKRKALHLSAVFACNFVNHLYVQADELLTKAGLSFDLLAPLIRETTQKALSMKPKYAQTGPARRLDKDVIKSHLTALENDSLSYQIYQILSESIMQATREE